VKCLQIINEFIYQELMFLCTASVLNFVGKRDTLGNLLDPTGCMWARHNNSNQTAPTSMPVSV
jgi:hypothetical protein